MKKHTLVVLVLLVLLVAGGAVATTALPAAAPVGPLPVGPVETLTRTAGTSFAVVLPKPSVSGRVWRIARSYDGHVVREIRERQTPAGAVRVSYRAVAQGSTRIVFALTRGERPHAYASRTFHVIVRAR